MRLDAGTLTALPATVHRPSYDRNRKRIGLAHLGAGAFHRCHQAEFTDDVLDSGADDRALLCINIKPPSLQDQIGTQDCYYTRTLRDDDANETRLIGAIRRCIDADGNTEAAIAALVTPEIETLTLTVTEKKGYCHIPATGALDESHADIVADLKPGAMPRSVPGFIVATLEARRKAGLGGLNLVSCDNIPSNGKVLEACALGFAAPRSKELSVWIQDSARFPSTMVDRIVPATALEDIENLAKAIGIEDRGAVFGEPFRQWVLEDSFIGRRPRWEAAGAELVGDVKPFELIKMRVLNAAQNDTLTGDGGINRLSGLAGDDTLRDGAGADILDGGLNNDTFLLDADGVSDTIIGGDGTADIVNLFFATGATSVTFGATAFAGTASGGGLGSNSFTGIERIFGSAFVDTILGGAGGEFLAARGGSDVISGGGGDDRLFGEAGNDTINDGSGVDVVIGGADNDALFLAADNQSDTVVGDTGTDTLDLFHASGATTVVFGATAFAGTASGGGLGTTSFTGIERIFGGNFAETIIGGAGGEYFFGRAGSDSIFGAQGSDIIFGDIGSDRLNGTAGADFLSGGADADTFVYTHQSQGADTFADFATGIDKVEIARTGFGLAPAYVLNFQTGAAAIGAGQVFLFNPANRQFLFDADGAGAMASVLLATLSVGSIAAGDILLV